VIDRFKEQLKKQSGCCINCLQKKTGLKFDPQRMYLICDKCFYIWYGRLKDGKNKSRKNSEA